MFKERNIITLVCVMILLFGVTGFSVFGARATIADVKFSTDGITWNPHEEVHQLILSVSCPDGTVFEKTFKQGRGYEFSLSELKENSCTDGVYIFELREVVPIKDGGRDSTDTGGMKPRKPRIQGGSFSVRNGSILDPAMPEKADSPQDIVHLDDVIIDGSLCVGNDCYDGLDFGYNTEVLMENNLRIFADDTSTVAGYPANDWMLIFNDSISGGASYFSISDYSDSSRPFTIEAGAGDHALYVDDYGRVGFGTSTPSVELHVVDGDSPSLRLSQDGSFGWIPQTWDICGNETNFFIRDVTHASKLPFRIQPDAPTSALTIRDSGYVGLGTWSPEYPLELETTGENATFKIERTSGAAGTLLAASDVVKFGSVTNHNMEVLANNAWRARFYPSNRLEMRNGAELTAAGVWTDASSIDFKENIKNLSTNEAVETLQKLNPVKYNYKADKDEQYVGFIAEHVPDLVATKSRKGMAPMDVVAVLTKVLQAQQETVLEQQKQMELHQKTIKLLNQRIEQLEKMVKEQK